MTTVFTNARLVLFDEVIHGSLTVNAATIDSIDQGRTRTGGSSIGQSLADWDGDYLIPGLVELHTDNMERHFMPRPKTYWPNGLAAVLTHDADVAAAGITTVFDSLCIGIYENAGSTRQVLFEKMVAAVTQARSLGLFRAQHKIHYRCELSDPGLVKLLGPLVDTPELLLVSLMDHTPGQRQWSDLDALRTFNRKFGQSPVEIERAIQERIERGSVFVPANRRAVLDLFRDSKMVLASHDDTTVEHITQAAADGVKLSEFPCSIEAARAAHEFGMETIGGAPNVVRGKSHSGNVAIVDLAREGLLDGLSSDYVPASLLQAAFALVDQLDMQLHEMIRLVTANPAAMVGLHDRGRLEVGRRADFIRVKLVENTAVVREVYAGGVRVA